MAAHKHVDVVTAANDIPVWDRIAGFTKMMYAIVTNVVKPASISVRHVVLWAVKQKYRSKRVSIVCADSSR